MASRSRTRRRGGHPGQAEPGPGPIRVAVIDVDDMSQDLPAEANGTTYRQAVVFVTRGGQLIGEVDLDLPATGLTADELRDHLYRALGDIWTDRVTSIPLGGRAQAPARPYITVVVATTMARVDELTRCVDSLCQQDYPNYDVILVDNRPDHSTHRSALYAQLTADPRVRVLTQPYPGISPARNLGAQAARGEIVAFTDDDAVAHPRWLTAIADRFTAESDTDCVTGVVLPAELETPAQIWFERSGSKLPQRYRPVTFIGADADVRHARLAWLRRRRYEVTAVSGDGQIDRTMIYRAGSFGMGANIAFRDSALRRIGWFDETLGTGTPARGGEDIAALTRLLYGGGRITMDPAVIVHHYHRPDRAGSLSQIHGYGVGASAALIANLYGDVRHLIGLAHLVPDALRVITSRSANRRAQSYPAELSHAELRGLLIGPWEYLRSRHRHARHLRRVARASEPSVPVREQVSLR